MINRKLEHEFEPADLTDSVLVATRLRPLILDWARARTEAGQALELMLSLTAPTEAHAQVEDGVGRIFFDDSEVHQTFKNKIVSVSMHTSVPQDGSRGFTFVVE
ncbi:MAG: hypothetical protein ACLPYZ_03585 [Limisphaerales bacterium]